MGLWHDTFAPLIASPVRTVYGESIAYTPASTGTPVTITAPFDAAPILTSAQTGEQVQGTSPQIDVYLADLALFPKAGDTLVRTSTGIGYRVSAVAPDGQGWATLTLVLRV